MKVCLVDPDYNYVSIFKDIMFGYAHVTHVVDAKAFGKLHLDFDCIVVEYMLPDTCGEYLVEAAQEKTKAQFAIVSAYDEHFNAQNQKNPAITGLFRKDKYDHDNLLEWVKRVKFEKELMSELEEMIEKDALVKNL